MNEAQHEEITDPRVLRVLRWLDEQSIPYKIHLHSDQEGITSEQASEALGGVIMAQILKSLLLQTKEGSFIGVIMTGNKKVSFANIQKIVGQKVSFAKIEDIAEQTGFERGGVPPFAFHFANIPAYVDKDVMSNSKVFGSAGSVTSGIEFSPAVFEKIKYTVADIGE